MNAKAVKLYIQRSTNALANARASAMECKIFPDKLKTDTDKLEFYAEVIMIARIWHGKTRPEKADSYLDYLNKTGMPDYRRTAGNLGAYVIRRIENGVAHFFTLTFWDSYDAIKRFAGKNYEKARYYPEDAEFLLEMEPKVQHFEVAQQPKVRKYVQSFMNFREAVPRWW